MKIIFILFIITINSYAQEDCPPEENSAISSLTSLQVPNCRNSASITAEAQRAKIIEIRRSTNKTIPNLPSPVCERCRQDFQARVQDEPNVREEEKNAYFETAYKELEKSLTSMVTDVISLRKTWNTGSDYSQSARACNTSQIQERLNKCNPEMGRKFGEKHLSDRMANEIAALLKAGPNNIRGILTRSDESKTCDISDEEISLLKPRLFEEAITPAIVQAISSMSTENVSNFGRDLENAIGANNARLLRSHPLLKPLMQDPSALKQFFQGFRTETNPERLKSKIRAQIYTKNFGDRIDTENANKCRETIQSFAETFCSRNFKDGKVSLGTFQNYEKYIDGATLPTNTTISDDSDINQNTLMFKFCSEPTPSNESLSKTMNSMNHWMLDADKYSPLSRFSDEKYVRDFGDAKVGICNLLRNPQQTCSPQDEQCQLLNIYRGMKNQNTPEGRLASSSDRNINRVLRSFIGDQVSSSLPTETRQVLVAEGILPLANGQFVERPQPPERDQNYLSGVANGTIIPNNGGIQSQLANSGATPQRQAPQSQQAVFQPTTQTQATTATTQAVTDDDDSEASRAVFNDLEARRLREQAASRVQPQSQTQAQPTRTPVRGGGTTSTPTPTTTTAAVPQNFDPAPSAVVPAAPIAPSAPTASLGRDTSAQTRSERDRNAALSRMSGAVNNPFAATPEGGRGPASTTGATSPEDQTVAITLSDVSRANLERVLNGSDSSGENLRNKIRSQSPFLFQLNNSVFDVQFTNGSCVVTSRSGDNRSSELATTLQGLFNTSLRSNAGRSTAGRNETLKTLRENLR